MASKYESKDEAMISQSLFKQEWSDLSKFKYDPKFDTDTSFIEDVAGLLDDKNIASEPEIKPKRLRCECPLKDSSNTADKKHRFCVPVSSARQKKAA